VTSIGRFYRADTSNFPPEDKNDAAAIAAMKNLLAEGLKGLKAKAEAK
jgi:mxaD protein